MSVSAPTLDPIEYTERQTKPDTSRVHWLGLTLTTATFAFAIAVVVAGLILAVGWYQRPFLGAVVTYTGNVIGTQPLGGGEWTGLKAGLQPDDVIVSVDGQTMPTGVGPRLAELLATKRPGDVITVQVLRPAARTAPNTAACVPTPDSSSALCTVQVPLMSIPFVDFAGYFGLGFLVAVVGLGVALWVWVRQRHQAAARTLIVIISAGAVLLISRFEVTATYQFELLYKGGGVLLGAMFTQLALSFPYPLGITRRVPLLRPALSGLAVGVFVAAALISGQRSPNTYDLGVLLVNAFLLLSGIGMIVSMVVRRRSAISALAREQASVLLIGVFVPIAPLALWFVTTFIERTQNLTGLSFSTILLQPPMLVFPLAMLYAISLRRETDTDRIISERVVLGILGLLLTFGYFALTGAVYVLTDSVIRPNNPILIAVTLFVIAVLFSPLRVRMERLVDRAFFRQRRMYSRRLEEFARNLTATIESKDVVDLLHTELMAALAPQHLFIFLQNVLTGDYEPAPDPTRRHPQTDMRFRASGGLVRIIESGAPVIYLERANIPPAELAADRPRLAVMNTPLLARMRSIRRLNGFIALGPRHDNAPYTYEDLRFLEGAASQAAAALERARIVLESQQNERALQVMVRVSTALNIAMDFDTLLEFIQAQISRVIPAPNFFIVLYDEKRNELAFVLYQEGEERVSEKEGLSWPLGRDLYSEVIRTRRPFRTDNYAREVARRGLPVDNPNLRAWVAVPLNAGENRIIGCLVISTDEPNIVYTEEQTRTFGNLADLAATALYKLRLLDETAQLAEQMRVLNETSGQLATFFEDIDALLENILQSAVTILDCEAGGLLLVEEESHDLVFRLAIGGSGQELVGSRIPAGSGVAGTVAATGQPMIVNDARSDPRWFGEVRAGRDGAAEDANFNTSNILAVPLTARGKVIGVLEVINKRDGTGFDDRNVNLLMTFAGQGAIAIENARLFRQTDEALEDRIRQLFNMQRIDQELNRTLDFQRVVDLTVDNAIRESDADAGLLALVVDEPPSFRVVSCAGYPEKVIRAGTVLPLDYGILAEVYRMGDLLLTPTETINPDDYAILPGTVAQLAVPMIRGEKVTGVLLLETTQAGILKPLTAEHIQSIAEHANTAISNAQLFEQVGQANHSRMKFVSMVAHELKTPLTSIKGYAEVLLAGSAFGPLTDKQREYLGVIQQNAVRLQNLVNDLRDLTAQETGNLRINFAVVDFASVVLDSVRPLQRAFDEKGQTVELEVPNDLPKVRGDQDRLVQVMTNFMTNANKYTPENGQVRVRVEHTFNVWDKHGPAEVIHCSVTDTGIGMSPEDLQNLFKPYWRSENPLARSQTGTGLGMSLTKGLIEAHGGKIWVESALGVGTTFHFTLPLAAQTERVGE
jgi:signal transduction histidine kinase